MNRGDIIGKNLGIIKCSVCGLSSEDDKNFHKKDGLCNRHWLQIKRNGEPTDKNKIIPKQIRLLNPCSVCGDKESSKYYIWHREGEFHNKEVCNKHYVQLIRHGYLLDKTPSAHLERHKWTKEDDKMLEELYKQGTKFDDICKRMNMTIGMINSRSVYLKLGDKYMRANNPKYTAVYQDYDWCYQRYIVKGMSHQEMADECGASLRTIQKWCSEIHRLNGWTFKDNKELSEVQYQIILFGTLGDGHIDKRENQPLYIECHALDEKDYLYWKYQQLKDLCGAEPKYYKEEYASFGTDKQYLCQPHYRFETRIINQLKEIREMPRIEKIKQLNEFGLCLHVLDDGSRRSIWELCLAEYTQEEIDLYIKICKDRFDINCWQKKDSRYITFDAMSSRKIDSFILNKIPNDLDVVKKKILNNSNIKKAAMYVYVVFTDNTKLGLSTYCRSHKIPYKKAKLITDSLNVSEIDEDTLLKFVNNEDVEYAI